jgi:hypothetical protein
MSSGRPPRIATWLLDRCCADEALAGDLVEEFGNRQSVAWYWKQALVAVAVYSTNDILTHKWLAIRAIVTGWAFWFILVNVFIKHSLQPWMDQLTVDNSAVAGMAVDYGRLMVLAVMYAIWVANGWVIGRLHRPYQSSMVLAYVFFALAASAPVVYGLARDIFDNPNAASALGYEVVTRTLTIVSLLGGGLLSTLGDSTVRSIFVRRAHRV